MSNKNQIMANKIVAQEKISTGSFVMSLLNDGHLVKSKMYRVKSSKEDGKYINMDTQFCNTTELEGKTLKFEGRFTLMSEEEVKSNFKIILNENGFINGQEFLDVRTKEQVKITSDSRTHVLAKFGKFMGIKIAGGHVWFAGNAWAKPMLDTETMPTPQSEEATPQSEEATPTTEKGNLVYVNTETQSEASHVCNIHGGGDEKWVNYWNVYEDNTTYLIDKISGRITAYSNVENILEEEKPEIPLISYEDWAKENGTQKTRKRIDMKTSGSLEEQIFAVVDEHLDSDESRQLMATAVEKLLNQWGIDKNVRQLEVSVNGKPHVNVGKIHYKYDLVLKCMVARTNVALVGAAGSGKTTTVAKAAEALELKFYSKSVSAQTGAHEFFGYQDAQGRYVRTLFREAYEFGGVFLLDEFDAGNPNVLAALNQATANEHCAFADDMIPKHKDFICVMAGNTFGHGANSEYVGRNKIDAATLDRFAFIDFPYDEDLEHALAPNKGWCKKVQAFRKKVVDKKIRTVISPRATIIGGQLLANGVTEQEVMELVIFKGLNQEERNLLK
jgi:cobaltochelatase CobS